MHTKTFCTNGIAITLTDRQLDYIRKHNLYRAIVEDGYLTFNPVDGEAKPARFLMYGRDGIAPDTEDFEINLEEKLKNG